MVSEPVDDITHRVIGCAIKVHRALGCGLLESAYEACLHHELVKCGYSVARQVALPVVYEGIRIDLAYRPDLVIDAKLIVEIKTVSSLLPIHDAQVLTYLQFSGIELGLLMNFHSMPLTKGIRRLILTNHSHHVSQL